MDLVSSMWHVLSAFLVFFAGLLITLSFKSIFEIDKNRAILLYAWHTLWCFVYLWYVLNNGGDSIVYYQKALSYTAEVEFGFRTFSVDYLTTLLVQTFGLSILGSFLVFNIFGTIGMLAFDGSLRIAVKNKEQFIRNLATLIVFLPSVSFWSSAIGKDALSFMATGLALWAALNLSRRALLMALSVAVMFLVRPHMAGMMVMALIFAAMLDTKANVSMKVFFGAVAAGVSTSMVPYAFKYAGVGDVVNAEVLMNYVELRQSYNMSGDGAVDISSMSLPMQLLTYLFRPFIFEARSIFSLAASLDNLILLYLFIAGSRHLLRRGKSISQENRVFMWAFSLLALLVLAMTTANLGIALRQKWMFTPMLIFLFISVIGHNKIRINTKS